MTAECHNLNPEIEREIKLYYFTVHEVSQMLHRSDDFVKKRLRGKMIWYDGRWMISPSDIQSVRK